MIDYNQNTTHNFVSISINYEKAHTEIRGKYTFFSSKIVDFVAELKNNGIESCFVISTCNRTEIYSNTINIEALIDVFCKYVEGGKDEFIRYIEIFKKNKAVHHLFRVASGLESQILGDFEIVGQLKIGFNRFKKSGITNTYMEKIVNTAIEISKNIKHQTSLSNGAASLSFAAVNYILTHVENISTQNIVLLGTGKIGQNTCENLIKHTKSTHITLVNRTPEKAKKLATKLLVKHQYFSELPNIISNTDILIIATSSETPIITKSLFTAHKKTLIIDLSVPENVSEEVRELNNIKILNVDELSKIIDETLEQRKLEIPKAEKIITIFEEGFKVWEENRKLAPAIFAFKEDLIRLNKVNHKNLKKSIPSLNGKETILSDKLAQKLTNRFAEYIISNPNKAEETIELMKEIFHLEWEA